MTDQTTGILRSDRPLVIDLRGKKKAGRKKRRRYSPGLEEVQEFEVHVTRASHHIARATEKGLAEYRARSQKSAQKKRDGAMRDFLPNSGQAMTVALQEASKLPLDLARVVNTPQNRKRIKRQVKYLSRSLRRLR